MAKGLRSKCRKASRAEFRNTIGKEDADKKFSVVQTKMQECIAKGGMNSIGRIAQQLHGTSNTSDMEDDAILAPDIDAMLASELTSIGKNPKKIPIKRKVISKIKYDIERNTPKGQFGAKLLKNKERKGMHPKKGQGIQRKRSSTKKMVSF